MSSPTRGFRIPVLKVKPLAVQKQEPARPERDRWTKSGAFQIPSDGGGGTIKVTPEGVHRNRPRSRGSCGGESSKSSEAPTSHGFAVDSDLTMDKLQLMGKLGSGASGEVRLARHKDTGVCYAVKKIESRNTNCSLKQTVRIFEEETKRLFEKHRSLVTTYQAFVGNDASLVLVQELMDVGSLERLMRVCEQNSVTVPEEVVSVLARQMLEGLQYLHSGTSAGGVSDRTMHRDMKPGNILLNAKGECKLADFGTLSEVTTAGKSSFVGTTTYMSPERIKGSRYGTPADIWAVGLIVLELALGKYPFEKGNFVQLLVQITGFNITSLSGVPDNLKAFVHSLMKTDSSTRPTAKDALELPFIRKYAASDIDAIARWLRDTVPEVLTLTCAPQTPSSARTSDAGAASSDTRATPSHAAAGPGGGGSRGVSPSTLVARHATPDAAAE